MNTVRKLLREFRVDYQGENKLLMASTDPELTNWIFNAGDKDRHAGSFVAAIADAATKADVQNYALIRPALLALKRKYPDYAFSVAELRNRPQVVDRAD